MKGREPFFKHGTKVEDQQCNWSDNDKIKIEPFLQRRKWVMAHRKAQKENVQSIKEVGETEKK